MFGSETPTPIAKNAPPGEPDQRLAQLRKELHARLIQSIDLNAWRSLDPEALRRELRGGAEELCRNQLEAVSHHDRAD